MTMIITVDDTIETVMLSSNYGPDLKITTLGETKIIFMINSNNNSFTALSSKIRFAFKDITSN